MATTHTDTSAVPGEPDSPRVMCLTPDGVDTPTANAFHEALRRAGRGGSVVLYDRTRESYRPDDDEALLPADDPSLDDVEGLEAAREAAAAAGVELLVWRSITPSIGTGVVSALQHASVGVVVVPAAGEAGSLGDVALGGGTDLVDALASLVEKPLVTGAGLDVELVTVESS